MRRDIGAPRHITRFVQEKKLKWCATFQMGSGIDRTVIKVCTRTKKDLKAETARYSNAGFRTVKTTL